MKYLVSVEGMSCGHCVKHVHNAIEELGNASNIHVSLEAKTAAFESNEAISDDKIKSAIEDAGYDVVKIDKQ